MSTMLRSRFVSGIAVLVLSAAIGPYALAAQSAVPPPPKAYVEDLADILDSGTEKKLLGYLQELEQKTGAQFIVLAVPSTDGEPIERFALRLAHGWKLGQKGKDNGLLLVIAVRDRKYRFETGYGLEGPLPDSYLGTIGRQYFQPNFRRGNYSKGVHDGVAAVLGKIAQHYNVKLSGVPKVRPSQRSRGLGTAGKVGFCGMSPVLLVFVVIILLTRVTRYWLGWWGLPIFFGGHHGYGSHRSGGWGGGGGGFGSFGGGGGGGFGGGGASGSW